MHPYVNVQKRRQKKSPCAASTTTTVGWIGFRGDAGGRWAAKSPECIQNRFAILSFGKSGVCFSLYGPIFTDLVPPKTKHTQDDGFFWCLQKGIWPRWNSEMNLLDGSKFWDGTTGTRQPLILHVWLGHCGDEWWRFSPIRDLPTSKKFSCLKFIKA